MWDCVCVWVVGGCGIVNECIFVDECLSVFVDECGCICR